MSLVSAPVWAALRQVPTARILSPSDLIPITTLRGRSGCSPISHTGRLRLVGVNTVPEVTGWNGTQAHLTPGACVLNVGAVPGLQRDPGHWFPRKGPPHPVPDTWHTVGA